jgi:hypothetical protein
VLDQRLNLLQLEAEGTVWEPVVWKPAAPGKPSGRAQWPVEAVIDFFGVNE